MKDPKDPIHGRSDNRGVDRLLAELLHELSRASVPGRIDELARQLQEELARRSEKAK